MSNETLPANAPSSDRRLPGEPLPTPWVERMFSKFEDRFGTLWHQRYAGIPITRVMDTWCEDLADLTPAQIKNGVDGTRNLKFPPTLAEFRELCLKSNVDPYMAYEEAIRQMHKRHTDGSDVWSHPAIYWSAVRIGDFDMRNSTWESIKRRWTGYLQEELAKATIDPVPPPRVALVAPGKTTITAEQAKANCARIKEMMRDVTSKMTMPKGD